MKNLVKVFASNGKIFTLDGNMCIKSARKVDMSDGDIFFLVKKKRMLDPVAGDKVSYAGMTCELSQNCTSNGWLTLSNGEKVRLNTVRVLNPRFEHFLDFPNKDEIPVIIRSEIADFINKNGYIGVFLKAYSFLKDLMLFLSHPFNGNIYE